MHRFLGGKITHASRDYRKCAGEARPRTLAQVSLRQSSISDSNEFVDLTVKLGAKDYGTYAAFRTQKESAQHSGAAASRRTYRFRGSG
jgi:hypothetical protein